MYFLHVPALHRGDEYAQVAHLHMVLRRRGFKRGRPYHLYSTAALQVHYHARTFGYSLAPRVEVHQRCGLHTVKKWNIETEEFAIEPQRGIHVGDV